MQEYDDYGLEYDEGEGDSDEFIQDDQTKCLEVLNSIYRNKDEMKQQRAAMTKKYNEIIGMYQEVKLAMNELNNEREKIDQQKMIFAKEKMLFEKDKFNFEKEKQKFSELVSKFNTEKLKFNNTKKLFEQSKRSGFQQMSDAYFKTTQQMRPDKMNPNIGMMNYSPNYEYIEEDENFSPAPHFNNQPSQVKDNDDYYPYEYPNDDEEPYFQNKFGQEYQMDNRQNFGNEYEDADNYINQQEYQEEMYKRNFNQDYDRSNEESVDDNKDRVNENQRYYSDDGMPDVQITNKYVVNKDSRNAFSKEPQNRNNSMPRESHQNQFAKQSRFKDLSNGQQQYLLEMQKKQEQQYMVNNPNMSNSYYEMGIKNYKHQVPSNENEQANPYFGNINNLRIKTMNNEGHKFYNNSYQGQTFNNPYAEVSFVKENSNPPINMISGSSTDRYGKSRNQGLHNYVSAGHVSSSGAPNSVGYSTQPAVGLQEPLPVSQMSQIGKEFSQNPPTFHPYHHLQNSSQINSQNSIQTPTHNSYMLNHLNNSKVLESLPRDSLQAVNELNSVQITPKIIGGKFINYETQIQPSFQFPSNREDSRERVAYPVQFQMQNLRDLEQQNSFWERTQQK